MTCAAILRSSFALLLAGQALPVAAQVLNLTPEEPDVESTLENYPSPPPIIDRPPPVFPDILQRLGAQANCSMVYSIGEDGTPFDVCGLCAVAFPAPPGVTPPPGMRERMSQDFLNAATDAMTQWRYEPGEPDVRYGTRLLFQIPNLPHLMPESPEPDICPGALIS